MWESLFNNVAEACNFIEKRPQHNCFPVNIAKFLRTSFFTEQLRGCFCFKLSWEQPSAQVFQIWERNNLRQFPIKYLKKELMDQLNMFINDTLQKIFENPGFDWPVFSRIRTESRISEKPCSCISYAVIRFIFPIQSDEMDHKID